ncbi:MAG: hypothetical protein AAGF15_00570 [Pseudomonadota bacterium]
MAMFFFSNQNLEPKSIQNALIEQGTLMVLTDTEKRTSDDAKMRDGDQTAPRERPRIAQALSGIDRIK